MEIMTTSWQSGTRRARASATAMALGLALGLAAQAQQTAAAIAAVAANAAPVVQPALVRLQMIPLLTISGSPGDTNRIEYANAFGDTNVWIPLTNLVLTDSNPYEFFDRSAPPGAQRFYRAVPLGAGSPPAPAGFVWLPPGRFMMGSPDGEVDRYAHEGPQTQVTLTRGFFMGQREVTQAEYQGVVGSNPSHVTGDPNLPVDQVNYYGATNYCGRLTSQEQAAGRLPAGWVYRLPTEAEWEYAARAGTTTRFSYGNDPGYTNLSTYAWYSVNSESTTHPVGQKQSNPWRLYDMYGNVWEWCSDWYGGYPGGSVTDPKGPATGLYHVLRGGGWYRRGGLCRSAYRFVNSPGDLSSDFGFRVVLAPGQP